MFLRPNRGFFCCSVPEQGVASSQTPMFYFYRTEDVAMCAFTPRRSACGSGADVYLPGRRFGDVLFFTRLPYAGVGFSGICLRRQGVGEERAPLPAARGRVERRHLRTVWVARCSPFPHFANGAYSLLCLYFRYSLYCMLSLYCWLFSYLVYFV